MTIRKSFLLCAVLCVFAFGYSLYLSPSLPEIVATHWNARGEVDGRGPKAIMLYLMPSLMALNLLLLIALPKLSPKKYEINAFISSYGSIWAVIQAMFLCLHFIFLQSARHETVDIARSIMLVTFLFFAPIGNWIGKVRQNFYMGVRTPWTLADARVWDATHRATGKIWFFGGLAGAVLSGLGLPWWIGITGFFAMTLYPVYLSWAIYRKLSP